MTEELYVKVFGQGGGEPQRMKLLLYEGRAEALVPCAEKSDGETIYLSDGFIDSHAHVYDGGTDLGISVDRIGYETGVHLVVDAGSSGAINFPCFRDYVMPAHTTPVKAFLNISRIGIVTKQPYFDPRVIDIPACVRCIREDGGKHLLGVKVMSSGLIVEKAGMAPLAAAAAAARECGVPLMAHLVEGPPSNDETLPLMQKGDIITHCFHGAPNIAANMKAARDVSLDPSYYSIPNVMWNQDGSPVAPLEDALSRGVYADVGHGAGSLDRHVAKRAILHGFRNFSISTDAHIRNIDGIVRSLPHTMSKFLAFGMTLSEVVASVTRIPARQLGLTDYCGHPIIRATLFRVRPMRPEDPPFIDSQHEPIEAAQVIEPVAIIRDGVFIRLEKTSV